MPRPLSSKLKSLGGYFLVPLFACALTAVIIPFFGRPTIGYSHPPGYVRAMNVGAPLFIQPWAAHLTSDLLVAASGFLLLWIIITAIANMAARRDN